MNAALEFIERGIYVSTKLYLQSVPFLWRDYVIPRRVEASDQWPEAQEHSKR